MKCREIIFAIVVFCFVLLFELSFYFATIGLNMVNSIKNILIIVILWILIKRNWHQQIKLQWYVRTFLFIMFLFLILQSLFGIASEIVTPLFGFIELFVAAKFSSKGFIKYLYASVVIVTLVTTIPLLYYYILYGYYARFDIVFEKSMMTFLYGFSFILLLTELFQTQGKCKYIILALLLYLLFVNVFILQSKTSIFALLVIFTLMFILRHKEINLTFKRYWKGLILVLAILPFLPIEWEIPDAMKQAANQLTGKTVFVMEREMKEDTYEIRGVILNRTIDIINEKPFFGAGFGNIASALIPTHTGITQGESQLIDFALEGGLTYLIAFAILTIPIVITSYKQIRNFKTTYADKFVFYQIIGFLILCTGNEMLSSLGWIFLGTLIYLLKTKQDIRLFI